ncbi:RNA polymerase factor sigma-70 [uncultured Roseburia sp.]|uniref:Sigma-70 family RNA polymerase sigma factor n=1 Tax=Brotonthovivens ammoniilytica TaxID=2981725 RepID=A0ABT2TN79_9FIRM|nr:sigma-70 family RNA polymerase sigma factor [Brotonthovivens ammoniilytica]MCU6763698.1 sigma-70 family RNA polymerase sigma factor [Brotonthovivens ammoniilytica]SCJ30989.1 RNA polymerase factor sigma-70 [uncultured Roseburia sp.]
MKEQEIVKLLLQKEEEGMKALLKHYGPLMRYIIAPVLSNEQDREDCLFEVAMKVWEKAGKYDPKRGSFHAWLTAVTRNGALNYKRSIFLHSNTVEIPEDMPSTELNPEDEAICRERQAAVYDALQHLSSKERTLFYRKYYYMQSTEQIASEMNMTKRDVEGKLYRLKKKLRRMLGG